MTLKMLLDRRNYIGSTTACVAWLHPPSVCGSLSAPCTVLPKIEFCHIHASCTKTSTLDDMIFLQCCVCVWRIVWKVLVCVCLEVHCLSARVCVGVCVCLYVLCVCIYLCVYVPVWVLVCVYTQYTCVCWWCVSTNHNAAGHHYSPKKVWKASLTSIVDQEFLNNFGTKFQNTDIIRLKYKKAVSHGQADGPIYYLVTALLSLYLLVLV